MRPASIVNFERAVLLMIVFGLAGALLRWDESVAYVAQQGYGEGLLIAIQAISFGLLLLLMWLIARRRSVIAKWIYVVLGVAGIALSVPSLGDTLGGPLPLLLLQVAQWVLTIVSIWLLFRPDAREWFAHDEAPAV